MFKVIINQQSMEQLGGGGGGVVLFNELPEIGDKIYFIYNTEDPATGGKVISVEETEEVVQSFKNDGFEVDAVLTIEV